MGSHSEPGGDQKTAEVERIPRVSIGTRNRESLVFGNVTGGPGADEHSDERDRCARCKRDSRRPRKNQIENSESKSKWQTKPFRHLGVGQSRMPRKRWRAMTILWISDVPSPISHTFASRIMRSTG